MSDQERRFLVAAQFEVRRAAAEKPAVVRGYAAKFDTLSEPMFGFREQIAPGAFAGVLEDDVRALFNHDPNHVLGRTSAGTLRISQDDTGLLYEVELPDTQVARDLVTSIERGDVSQSSFAFRIAPNGDTWDENEDGVIIRTITKFGRLYDVSPVTYPAYPDATAGMRSLDEWRKAREDGAVAALKAAQHRRAKARARLLRMR